MQHSIWSCSFQFLHYDAAVVVVATVKVMVLLHTHHCVIASDLQAPLFFETIVLHLFQVLDFFERTWQMLVDVEVVHHLQVVVLFLFVIVVDVCAARRQVCARRLILRIFLSFLGILRLELLLLRLVKLSLDLIAWANFNLAAHEAVDAIRKVLQEQSRVA